MTQRRVNIRYARFENGARVEYKPGAVVDLSDAEIKRLGQNSEAVGPPAASPLPSPAPAPAPATVKPKRGRVAETPVFDETAAPFDAPLFETAATLEDHARSADEIRAHFNPDDF